MWNNLKSDIYRALHTKSFYIILISLLVLYGMILTDSGVQTNTPFAQFTRGQNTVADYLFYFPKSGLFVALTLLFLSIFASDEYTFDCAKNTYSIHVRKWELVLSRYIFNIIVIGFYFLILLVETLVIQTLMPMEQGSIEIGNYIIYMMVQIGILAAVASFIMLVIHFTRSRVLSILISIIYGAMMWYMFLGMIMSFMFDSNEILCYTMYEISGKLPQVFSWNGYQMALLILVGNTLLYNGISYFILKKKDI